MASFRYWKIIKWHSNIWKIIFQCWNNIRWHLKPDMRAGGRCTCDVSAPRSSKEHFWISNTNEKSTSFYFCGCGDVDAGGGGCRCANNTGLFWAVRRSGAKGLTSLPRSWNHTATTSYMTWQGMLSQPLQLWIHCFRYFFYFRTSVNMVSCLSAIRWMSIWMSRLCDMSRVTCKLVL